MNSNQEYETEVLEEELDQDFQDLADSLEEDKKMSKKEKKAAKADATAKLEEENGELKDQLLRKTAEFENFRKRTLKEKEEMGIYAKGVCVKELLTPIDNFERALATTCKDPDFQKGMEMILAQFEKSLTTLGVVEIEALNTPFDPELHNAIQQVDNPEFEANTVCQVMQKGYIMGDKVIRHAMVVVANP